MSRSSVVEALSEEYTPRVGVIRKIWELALVELKTWWTYRLWVILDVTGTVLHVATYVLVSKFTSPRAVAEAYGRGDFFTFAVLGLAFQMYVFGAIQGIAEAIREEQWRGTMESILSTSTGFITFLAGKSLATFILATYFLAAALATGLALGAKLEVSFSSAIAAAVLSLLLIVSHSTIGVLSAGVIMKFKEGSPVVWLFSWSTQLFSGVLYPLGLLPPWLRVLSKAFPLTYSLDALRLTLMAGETLASPRVAANIRSLLAFTAVTAPISMEVFRRGYNSSRRDGSLGQY